MKKAIVVASLAIVLAVAVPAGANSTGFYAVTDGVGYQGTIWNITEDTGPWTTSTPRNANLYLTVGLDGDYGNWNQLASSWSTHRPSNQNDSFVQLAGTATETGMASAVGGWDSSLKVFTVAVTGANAPYPWSRMWQPDNGVAWGVNFLEYTYTFVATFANEATLSDGWLLNTGAPTSVVGNFSGQFQVTADVNKNPINNGDVYGFNIGFDSLLFDNQGYDLGTGLPIELVPYNEFGAAVPEPLTMAGLFMGIAGLAGYIRKRRMA